MLYIVILLLYVNCTHSIIINISVSLSSPTFCIHFVLISCILSQKYHNFTLPFFFYFKNIFFLSFFFYYNYIRSNVKELISPETKLYHLCDFRTKIDYFTWMFLNLTFIFSILKMFLNLTFIFSILIMFLDLKFIFSFLIMCFTKETEIVYIVHILVFTSHCSFHIADISLFKSYRQNPSKYKIHIDNG